MESYQRRASQRQQRVVIFILVVMVCVLVVVVNSVMPAGPPPVDWEQRDGLLCDPLFAEAKTTADSAEVALRFPRCENRYLKGRE